MDGAKEKVQDYGRSYGQGSVLGTELWTRFRTMDGAKEKVQD